MNTDAAADVAEVRWVRFLLDPDKRVTPEAPARFAAEIERAEGEVNEAA